MDTRAETALVGGADHADTGGDADVTDGAEEGGFAGEGGWVIRSEAAETRRYPFGFTGSGGEYFRIWIVNVFLTIVTLYVYSAWAKVRTMRYFHGNTVLDGSAFEYHARPLQILAGRIVAVVLFALATLGGAVHPAASGVATLVLFAVLPWAVWRSTMFNARMTSYRNVRFGFEGRLGRLYLYLLVLPFLPLVLAGGAIAALANADAIGDGETLAILSIGIAAYALLAPWVHARLAAYLADNYRYGRAQFAATVSTMRFYAIYIQALALSVAVFALFGLLFGLVVGLVGWSTGMFDEGVDGFPSGADGETTDETMSGALALAPLVLYPLFLMSGYFVSAFFRARIRNHLYAGVLVDERVRLESTVRTWPLWRLLVGNLVLLVFTLGLAYPWTKVRLARFFAERTTALAEGDLHAVVDEERKRQSALGEELGDAFDMDMDVGF